MALSDILKAREEYFKNCNYYPAVLRISRDTYYQIAEEMASSGKSLAPLLSTEKPELYGMKIEIVEEANP